MSAGHHPAKPGSPEWYRKITASKVSTILGLSPWESPRSLWHKMRGELPPEPDKAVFRRGHHLEAGILNWYFEDNPHLDRVGGETWVSRPDLPWAGGYPDDIATDRLTGERFPVDAKTDGRGTDWGAPGSDEVPLPYVCQAMWVMHLGGFDRFVFVRLGPFLERDEFEVRYDPALARDIEAQCHAFYLSLADDGAAPELDDTLATYDAVRAVAPIGDGDWECPPALARDLCRARADIDAAEARYNLARSRVIEQMGEFKRAVCSGQVLGQKQRTKSGAALYPPRKPVVINNLPAIPDTTTETTEDAA